MSFPNTDETGLRLTRNLNQNSTTKTIKYIIRYFFSSHWDEGLDIMWSNANYSNFVEQFLFGNAHS